MTIVLTRRAAASIADAPLAIRRAFAKQLVFLENDLNHPSLRAKKYNEAGDVWQARVNRDWRFYFKLIDDSYVVQDVMPHPK